MAWILIQRRSKGRYKRGFNGIENIKSIYKLLILIYTLI
jgi:hypothetical protein